MSTTANDSSKNAVFPVKMTVSNLKTEKQFSVLSTGVIDTSQSQGSIKVLFTDGQSLFTMESGEFNEKFLIVDNF